MLHVSDTYNFFNQLNSLLKSDIPITQSLTVVSNLREKSKKAQVSKMLAADLLESIQKGYSFSRATSICTFMKISDMTVRLLEAGEHAACLSKVINFLCLRYEKEKQVSNDIKNAMAYPVVVVVSALISTFLLILWKDLYLTSMSTKELLLVVVRAITVLILLFSLLCLYVRTSIKEPKLFQLYYTLGFLQESGFTFCHALELYMGNVDSLPQSALLSSTYNKISKGFSISSSLKYSNLTDDRSALLLELAEKSGTIGTTCTKIAENISESYDRKKRRCLQLLEPFVLLIVGLYLLVLMEGIFIPYITDFGGIL